MSLIPRENRRRACNSVTSFSFFFGQLDDRLRLKTKNSKRKKQEWHFLLAVREAIERVEIGRDTRGITNIRNWHSNEELRNTRERQRDGGAKLLLEAAGRLQKTQTAGRWKKKEEEKRDINMEMKSEIGRTKERERERHKTTRTRDKGESDARVSF